MALESFGRTKAVPVSPVIGHWSTNGFWTVFGPIPSYLREVSLSWTRQPGTCVETIRRQSLYGADTTYTRDVAKVARQ